MEDGGAASDFAGTSPETPWIALRDTKLYGERRKKDGESTRNLTEGLSSAGEVLAAVGDGNGARWRSELGENAAAVTGRLNRRSGQLPGRHTKTEEASIDREEGRRWLTTAKGGKAYRRSVRARFRRRRSFGERRNGLPTLRRC